MVGVAELKTRNIGAYDRGLAYMDLHKWFALSYASVAFGVPAVYMVAFNDGVRWCDVQAIDARCTRVVGRRDRGNPNDVHPAVVVPVADMSDMSRCPL
jgi:hypothetical protein